MFDMFSLGAMDLCDDAVELEFSSSEMNAVFDDVVGVFS